MPTSLRRDVLEMISLNATLPLGVILSVSEESRIFYSA